MTIQFYIERVTFTDVTISNGLISKEIFHTFSTNIKSGSANLSGFFIAYPEIAVKYNLYLLEFLI